MSDFIQDNMLIEPRLQNEIIHRAQEANQGDTPQSAIYPLGSMELPDGKNVRVFLRHAADALLMDHRGNIVLITRRFNPGAGKLALPGGFIDLQQGKTGASVVEQAASAALREAMEETSINHKVLANAVTISLGHRAYNRPFDIRSAWDNIPGTEIAKGDLFCVSTQGFLIQTQCDLTKIVLKAQDDAQAVCVLSSVSLRPNQFGIADHYAMIVAAARENKTPILKIRSACTP